MGLISLLIVAAFGYALYIYVTDPAQFQAFFDVSLIQSGPHFELLTHIKLVQYYAAASKAQRDSGTSGVPATTPRPGPSPPQSQAQLPSQYPTVSFGFQATVCH